MRCILAERREKPTKVGEMSKTLFVIQENITKYYGMLTKLLPPNIQVTLSQLPPSKKETQGVEGTLCFPARPRVNSKKSFVACEPVNIPH